MSDIEREIHSELLAIHSKLGTIDGKVTLLARSRREQIRNELAELVVKKPLIAQIYLVLDGKRTQRDVVAELAAYGIDVHEATVSRHITREMLSERGLVDLVGVGASKVYAKNREMNEVLNLAANMRKWLEQAGETVPLPAPRPRRKQA